MINYKIEGTPNSPVLIFSNSLGSEMMMWDDLIPSLLPYFRILRYDARGHGSSPDFDQNQSHSIENLAKDAIQLMDDLGIEKAYFCGLSMGGLIGQFLGINYASRFEKIVISNTAAKIGDEDRWNDRIEQITNGGMNAIVDDTIQRWFKPSFIQQNSECILKSKAMFLRSNVAGYSNCCEAIRDVDFREQLQNLKVETLVIAGDEDPVTNISHAIFLNQQIPNSTLEILPARHLSATELPNEFAQVLIKFFIGKSTLEKGMHVRRSVLGNAHVDKSIEKLTPFNTEFQRFISHYAWGEIWTRPGLSKHNRSLITIAMLIALNRKDELKMHFRAAFNNGVTKNEIKEVLMHSALYCGLPAANEGIHTAEEVFKDLGI